MLAANSCLSYHLLTYPLVLLAGIPLAASTVALGLANVAKINGAKFAEGGFVGGGSFAGDTVPILANSGEFVANRSQQNNILEAVANGGNSGGNNNSESMERLNKCNTESQQISVSVDGREIARATRNAISDGLVLS